MTDSTSGRSGDRARRLLAEGKNIFLAGFMGTGKSAAGRSLAAMLGAPFVDLDGEIEKREVTSITEIFERRGEEYFREIEHGVLEEISRPGGRVIALGGGVVCVRRNREILERAGETVLLTAEPEEIWRRVGHARHRPLLKAEGGYERMVELLRERERDYSRYPRRVSTSGKEPEEVAGEIAALLEERQ